MSGQQRRGPEHRPEERVERASGAPEAELGAGNAAFAEQIGGDTESERGLRAPPPPSVTLAAEVARDTARPVVERGRLALEITPIAPKTLTRFVDVLGRSALAPEQRERLIDKLRTDDAAARGIADAVTRSFPGGTREALAEVLDAVERALLSGSVDGSGWRFGALRVEVADGGASAGADALIAALADGLASAEARESLGPSPGERVVRYCHAVALLLSWEEEEEEEFAAGVDVELV
jgi:hypothetical protein